MTYIMWLNDLCEGDALHVGGKAAALGRLINSGFRVPPGFCITTRAFADLIGKGDLARRIQRIADGAMNSQALPRYLEAIQEDIDVRLIDEGLRDEILGACSDLIKKQDVSSVAVRSSASSEDTDEASFAGQYKTFLFVPMNQILDRIVDVWRSAFEHSLVLYCSRLGIPPPSGNIAVIIQAMLKPEKAGVMFTVDPVFMDKDAILIESSWGLGASVVSDRVTPDRFVVGKKSMRLEEIITSQKEMMLVLDESVDCGVVEKEVPKTKVNATSLTKKEVIGLAQLGLAIEKLFGKPQDIEWAIQHGQVYVLQSRPVTSS